MSKKQTFIGSSKNLDPELKLIQDSGLSKNELDELKDQLKKIEIQKGGISINKYELFDILKVCGYFISEKLKKHVQSELEKRVNNQIKKIDFLFVVEMAVAAKKIADEENSNNQKMSQENAEYLDAFIAMGGGPNTEGFVKKNIIIDIIKNEFELTFDMEDFLEEISATSDDLDFKSFCQLFDSSNDDDSKSVGSKRSFLSKALSEKLRRKSSFQVKYKDFLKFCEKMDNVQQSSDK